MPWNRTELLNHEFSRTYRVTVMFLDSCGLNFDRKKKQFSWFFRVQMLISLNFISWLPSIGRCSYTGGAVVNAVDHLTFFVAVWVLVFEISEICVEYCWFFSALFELFGGLKISLKIVNKFSPDGYWYCCWQIHGSSFVVFIVFGNYGASELLHGSICWLG